MQMYKNYSKQQSFINNKAIMRIKLVFFFFIFIKILLHENVLLYLRAHICIWDKFRKLKFNITL